MNISFNTIVETQSLSKQPFQSITIFITASRIKIRDNTYPWKLLVIRDEAGKLERAIDLAHADARDGMEFVIAENATEQAKLSQKATMESRRLNRLVAFFPLATLISLFGMNPIHEVLGSNSFWWIIVVEVLLGLVVGMIVGRHSKKAANNMLTKGVAFFMSYC